DGSELQHRSGRIARAQQSQRRHPRADRDGHSASLRQRDPHLRPGISLMRTLTAATASRFARIALGHVTREFPHKLDHVLNDGHDALTPSALHPVFHGSFDWHSCVHGYWLLARVQRRFPLLPEGEAIRALMADMLTPEKVA